MLRTIIPIHKIQNSSITAPARQFFDKDTGSRMALRAHSRTSSLHTAQGERDEQRQNYRVIELAKNRDKIWDEIDRA